MIILFDFDKDPVKEYDGYEEKLRRDVSKRIVISKPYSWYEAYHDKAFSCMVTNAFNQEKIRNNIVLIPSYDGVVTELLARDKLKDVYWIAIPSYSTDKDKILNRCKEYVIDFPAYPKFVRHVSYFVKKEDKCDAWKWFRFMHSYGL